jgi:hypothetical protein
MLANNNSRVLLHVFFNLPRRPCEGLAVELILSTAPSGLVPGVGGDGCRLSPMTTDNFGGPDCIFFSLFRV